MDPGTSKLLNFSTFGAKKDQRTGNVDCRHLSGLDRQISLKSSVDLIQDLAYSGRFAGSHAIAMVTG